MVLLGVEHLEQRRRRVAAEVVPQLVDLVEHEDRVVRARLLHALDEAAGQRADVGAPVAADLGLVAHAAERDADELAPQRARDRAAERRLADAGRPDEAQDRPLLVGLELAHRQVLEDALLDLLEVVVVGVEDVARLLDVELVLGGDRPRQLDQPLEVGARHRVLGRRRLHHLEPLELLHRDLLGLGRHLGVDDLLAEVVQVAAGLVDLAQLLLDRLQLLAQDVLALVAPHLLLDLAVDLLADLQHLVLAREELQHLAQAGLEIERLQHVLLLVDLHVEVRRDEVGQLPRLGHAVDQRARLLGQLGHQLDDPLGDVLQVHDQRVELDVGRRAGRAAAAPGRS